MGNMPTSLPQVPIPGQSHLRDGEEILFHKRISKFFGASDHWLLTSQRLLQVGKSGLDEKKLYDLNEKAVLSEIGEFQFSGNVHLLTNQRIIVLDIGANDYILETIPLSKVNKVDIQIIREGLLNSLMYGLQITVMDDGTIVIKHGGIITEGIDKQEMSLIERQKINERFPRKICEVTGLSLAIPQKRISKGGMTYVDFYSKSDLAWPQICSACYINTNGLVYDEYTVENTWLAAGYRFSPGLIPQFTYQIPYCQECYTERFGFTKNYRSVKAGWSQSNGARVELCFENQAYATDFIRANSH
jgi:hypothetical protein